MGERGDDGAQAGSGSAAEVFRVFCCVVFDAFDNGTGIPPLHLPLQDPAACPGPRMIGDSEGR